jgi:O-antigen/teichoic acid export membrane protein
VGTIFVYGINGPADAGLFFMALTIVAGITNVMYSLFTISLPAMSAMKDERRTFTTYVIKLSLLIALPLSFSLMYYSREILELLGPAYMDASFILEILILSLLPTAVQYGVTSVVYSYGKYREVLCLGLATGIPRIFLYYALVPILGGFGGAIGYTIGAILGFVVSIYIAKKNETKLEWKNYSLIFFVPLGVGYVIQSLHVNFISGMLSITLISYVVFYLLRIISINEINTVLKILPNSIVALINKLTRKKNFDNRQ